ncbi:unnamed protein product, partial [Hapterophycus canaliculatus]
MQASEEKQQDRTSNSHEDHDRNDRRATAEEGIRSRGEAGSRASSRSHQSGLNRSISKRSSVHGTSNGESRGSSRGGHGSQVGESGAASSSAEPDQNGYPEALTMGHLETAVRILTMLARGAVGGGGSGGSGGFSCSTFDERLDLLMQAHYFVERMATMIAETVECGRPYRLYEQNVPEGAERARMQFSEWWDTHGEAAEAEAEPSTSRPPAVASRPPVHLRDWAYWRPESDPGLYRYMAVPPAGREPYALSAATIEKPPLLYHHLLDLAEGMEAHGLAAHAAAPLAMSELVARLCLGSPLLMLGSDADGDLAKPGAGKGAADGVGENAKDPAAVEVVFPALALACLRRSRLLLKLGPTCHRAALQAAAAAGPLGVSAEEATRRGAEVDRILRQREEKDPGPALRRSSPSHQGLQQQPQQIDTGEKVLVASPSPDLTKMSSTSGSKKLSVKLGSALGVGGSEAVFRGVHDGVKAEVMPPAPPTLGKLEDRKLWALLAKEAVLLGECRAAAEYLAAAQRHNDAFHDSGNVVSCLEAQAALCDAQGHPEQGLPCLLRASALLRVPGVGGSNARRWGSMALSIGGMMRKANMGDAKIRRALQTGCDALEGSMFRYLDNVETGEAAGRAAANGLGGPGSSMGTTNSVARPGLVDLDAAVVFSGCVSLLAEASSTLDDSILFAPAAMEAASAAKGTPLSQECRGQRIPNISRASNATATTSATPPQHSASDKHWEQHGHQERSGLPAAVRLLSDAADKLRPLGNHPALPAILRRTAQEWVRRWAKLPAVAGTASRSSASLGVARGMAALPVAELSELRSTETRHVHKRTLGFNHRASEQRLETTSGSRVSCLENAAACLAEARVALSALAAAAEPTGDVLSSSPPTARDRVTATTEKEDDGNEAPAAKAKGKSGKSASGSEKGMGPKAAAAGEGKKSGGGGAASSTTGRVADATGGGGGSVPGGTNAMVVSTPVGRNLVMVQLEEACVRAMLGRTRGEGRSSKKAEEAAANEEGVTPVQRYLEASRPLEHPTPKEMELPQVEQALALAQMARERCSRKSLYPGGTNIGLLPLALAWEGSTLALLAARAGLCDGAWLPRPPPSRPPTPPQAVEPEPAAATKATTKGGKGAAEKGAKGVKGGAVAAGGVSEDDDGKAHVDVPPMQ